MEHEFKSLTIYIDQNNGIIILSCGESKRWGGTMDIDVEQRLTSPYSTEELEIKLQNALEQCYSKEVDEYSKTTPLEIVTNIKDYAKAVKTRRLVYLECDLNKGYRVVPTEKIPRQGYVHLEDEEIKLPLNYSKNQLAEAVNKAISLSTKNKDMLSPCPST
jgi:hypothetical protein